MTDYQEFLKSKALVFRSEGVSVADSQIHPMLFPFQRDLVRWACRKGRAAIFADTGLGKTFMQLEWGRLIGGECLIVAPLSVAKQTVREGLKIGCRVTYARTMSGMGTGINITNYEMIGEFDPSRFKSVVLDESSILKGLDGKTRKKVTSMFAGTHYKLCCTATPAPNDIAEIANHAEFLGIMKRADMLASFFVHESSDNEWRLKGHAEESFYRWLASWGMSVKKPSDLGYEDDGFILPPLEISAHFVESNHKPKDRLFFGALRGIQDRSSVRRGTIQERLAAVVDLVARDSEQWIVWCGLNDEGRELAKQLTDAALVEGSQSIEEKIRKLESFQDGETRVLVTKAKIAGHGLNLQNCHKMAFLGLNDSWEQYYQCIRRCHRFGQKSQVEVHIVVSEQEKPIFENVMRKEREASAMSEKLVRHVREFEREEISGVEHARSDIKKTEQGDDFMLMLGDACERIEEIPDGSVDLSVFSPPFISLYSYTPTERDLGNSKTREEFFEHFKFVIEGLLRLTKPGRNCCVHVSQVPAMLVRDGFIGMFDFRADVVRAFIAEGWVYHGEVCIDKCPQAQAIRTHAKGLLFVQLRKDASWLRPAMADYILVFRKPGENKVPVEPDITNEDWIEWARPVWYGIKETDTLNTAVAREDKDGRHICPLQLGVIERCVRLWSNPGETVFDPFAGIGSTGYVALQCDRKFIGIELKESYWRVAFQNLRRARQSAQGELFTKQATGATP